MNTSSDSEIVKKFLKYVDLGNIDQIKVIYKVNGGVSEEHFSEEITFDGTGDVNLNRKDNLIPEHNIQDGTLQLNSSKTQFLFRDIGKGFETFYGSDDLLPDSLVGLIIIQFENNKSFRYFLASEQDRLLQDKPLSSQMENAILQIRKISEQIGGN